MKTVLALALCAARVAATGCKDVSLDFVMLEGDATQKAVEEMIRDDLAVLGITVNARFLEKDDLNAAMTSGDFDMVFSETWGAPYDPHSYAASWTTPDEAHYPVMQTLAPPLDPASFAASIADVLSETDPATRQQKWTTILSDVHEQVLHLPLYGKRIPAVINNQRLSGYRPGFQQFDYPLAKATVVAGSKTVTVAPGAQSGLFNTVGRLDPHTYRPNEFFANNWVYEGLVAYGADGKVEPALATSWTTATTADGGEEFRFTLREGVTFHDGAAWSCAVAKLNFDHFFVPALTGPGWHGWYGLPGALDSWTCDGEVFVVKTKTSYYPLLQELTYIRPTRMLSPNSFVGGITSDPLTQNSCHAGWGTVEEAEGTAVCAGITAVSGTGPFKLGDRVANEDGGDDQVDFLSFADYWGGAPDIETLRVVRYDSHDDVKAALLDGSLDAVVGSGVLAPTDITDFVYADGFDVSHGEATQNTVLIMNIADDDVRKTVVHAVDKGAIIEQKLGGFEEAVSQVFSQATPYAGKDLTPKFFYDKEKAELLHCGGAPATPPPSQRPPSDSKSGPRAVSGSLIGLFAASAVMAVVLAGVVYYMYTKEMAGEPIFAPVKSPMQALGTEDEKGAIVKAEDAI